MYKQMVLKKHAAIVYMIPFVWGGLLLLALLELIDVSAFIFTVLQLVIILLSFLGIYVGYLKSRTQFAYYFFSDELVFKLVGKHGTRVLKTLKMDNIQAIYPIDINKKWNYKLHSTANYSGSFTHKGKYYLVANYNDKKIKICFEPDETMLCHLYERIPEAFPWKRNCSK